MAVLLHQLFLSSNVTSLESPSLVSTVREAPQAVISLHGHINLLYFYHLTRAKRTGLLDMSKGCYSSLSMECQMTVCLFCCYVLILLNFIWCLWSCKIEKVKKSLTSCALGSSWLQRTVSPQMTLDETYLSSKFPLFASWVIRSTAYPHLSFPSDHLEQNAS
jgi:hypothetical protein